MRQAKPSLTARHVALTRATFDRPTLPTGDAEGEARLYRSLGPSRLPRGTAGSLRMRRRTAFFDGETLAALRQGIGQVVIVAAGYDGRALRFATPGVRWFEVDHPSTQADKRARLVAAQVETGHIRFVAVDLTGDDLEGALRGAGHDPALRSMFLVEGLLGYLPRRASSDLLSTLAAIAAPQSRLAVAFPTLPRNPRVKEKLHLKMRSMVVSAIGEPWLVRFEADEPDSILQRTGWEIAPSDCSPSGRVRFEGRQGVLIGALRPGSGPVPTLGAL